MSRKSSVLITGASGEIGHALIARLSAGDPDRPIVTLDLNPLPPESAAKVRQAVSGSILDTALFFSFAFAPAFSVFGPNDEFAIGLAPVLGVMTAEAPRWISWALGDLAVKVLFALILLMPYGAFLAAARELRHEVEALAARFGVSFEQAAHRLSTLQRDGARGVPFFFLRVDPAGKPAEAGGRSCASPRRR